MSMVYDSIDQLLPNGPHFSSCTFARPKPFMASIAHSRRLLPFGGSSEPRAVKITEVGQVVHHFRVVESLYLDLVQGLQILVVLTPKA